jgi:hypothetical protein
MVGEEGAGVGKQGAFLPMGANAEAHSLSRHCHEVGARTFLFAATFDRQDGLGSGLAALRFGACCGQECQYVSS